MIVECLRRHALERPDEAFLADDAGTLSFRDTERQAAQMAGVLRKAGIADGSAVYLYARDSARLVVALLATQYCGARVCVLNRSFDAEDLRRFAQRLQPGPLITDAPDATEWPEKILSMDDLAADSSDAPVVSADTGGIVILTTGTTGTPKAVLYAWEQLLAQARLSASAQNRRWALLYPLNHFAGLQVFLHAIRNGLLLAIPRTRQFSDVLACLIRCEVDSASATPTFWRMFSGKLNAEEASQLKLRQITLGGEPITADILARLRQLLPEARVTQVFAATEVGSCFAVSDGLPGFPAEFLAAPVGNVELMIQDGQLHVRTALGMVGYLDSSPQATTNGWVATGDIVEVRGDRVYFLGRKGEVINVGGVKVYPPTVEEQIRKVSGVRDVRVYGKANPVTGQIVAADIELAADVASEAALAEIRRHCRATLSRYEQPRELHVVSELGRSNEKLIRR